MIDFDNLDEMMDKLVNEAADERFAKADNVAVEIMLRGAINLLSNHVEEMDAPDDVKGATFMTAIAHLAGSSFQIHRNSTHTENEMYSFILLTMINQMMDGYLDAAVKNGATS
jgi:hypothetical protein